MVLHSPKRDPRQEPLPFPRDGWRDRFPLSGGFRPLSGTVLLLFGVLLPALTLGLEIAFGMSRAVLFDPIPTPLHALLVGLVPAANLALWLALQKDDLKHARLLAWLNGAALGISFCFALPYLPLMPLAAVAIVIYGLGLLLLAPSLAFTSALYLRRRLVRSFSENAKPRGMWPGFLAASGLLLALEMPSALTRFGVNLAASEDAGSQAWGLRLLRVAGDPDVLLDLCYDRPGRATDLMGWAFSLGKSVDAETAQAIHYRVRGIPFNALPAPEEKAATGLLSEFGDGDRDRGGAQVAGMVPHLTLAASRLDASIDAQAALGYQEWTLEFANGGDRQAEARAQIQLPPGGVVSRLTLWVNGEEREAAFAAKGQVRQAYERVVRARRDPVLVTLQGQDRVLMQCFPVPEKGRMKVRLGITAPLAFASAGVPHFHLPRFTEKNFGVPDGKSPLHSLWVESTGPLAAPGEDWDVDIKGGSHVLRGRRGDAWLSAGRSVAVEGSHGPYLAWTDASPHLEGGRVLQWGESAERKPLGPLKIVVDLSREMRPHLKDVAAAIRRADRPVHILAASAESIREYQGLAQRAGDWLERQPCVGGQDNVPALLRAWDLSPKTGVGTVLWIHAAQPVNLSSPGPLRQALEREPRGPRILAVQAGNGPNRLLEGLQGLPGVSEERLSGSFREELAALVSPEGGQRLVLRRKAVGPKGRAGQGKATSGHLAKLHAFGEVLALLEKKGVGAEEQAVAKASLFQLVTPVTGAVVLETASQYAEAGLQTPGAATVPGIPEPETVALLAVGALVLLFRLWTSRRRRTA